MRSCAVLLHITSLPSRGGIGSLGHAARDFIRFLKEAGQSAWQILPTTPAGEGNSPYSSYSAFAGNPLLLDLEDLVEMGLLQATECNTPCWGSNARCVDYERVKAGKYALLRCAYERFLKAPPPAYAAWCAQNKSWLNDYALYMALKTKANGAPWQSWAPELAAREVKALAHAAQHLQKETGFWRFTQYQFFCQWAALRAYAAQNGILLIGDVPIYVALDSADVWANRELFLWSKNDTPTAVAGVPPDAFCAEGQLWGNPLYNWSAMAQDHYAWWCRRMKSASALCDVLRLDHFRGFASYYAIPYGERTAEHGTWQPGPGMAFFHEVEAALGKLPLIAEDLGALTPDVFDLLRESGFPGMKILEFAFDSDTKNPYLPFCYTSPNCVSYTGTHDNNTVNGWYQGATGATRRFARRYLGLRHNEAPAAKMVECVYRTQAALAVVPLQDFLGLGSEGRMNTPAVPQGNWSWRALERDFTPQLARRMRELAQKHGRCGGEAPYSKGANVVCK